MPGFDTDYFPQKVRVLQAQDFTVVYNKTYKVVVNRRLNEKYLLYQCGTPVPSGFDDHKKFAIPLQTVAVEDTTVLRFLELLGLQATTRYMQKQYVTSGCLQTLASNGNVLQLEPSYGGNAQVRQAQVDLVDALFTSSASSSQAKSIGFTASSDPGSLQRAEWIKFIAVFFNKEQAANAVFDSIWQRYQCRWQSVAMAGVVNKPVVAWMYYASWSSSWVLSNAPFKRQLLLDAGAQPLGTNTTDQTFRTVAELQAALAPVDILIDESWSATRFTWANFLEQYSLTEASTLKFMVNKQVWRPDGLVNAGESWDWFAGAVAEADAVLEDLRSVMQSSTFKQGTWLRRLYDTTPRVESTATCTNALVAAMPKGGPCAAAGCLAAGAANASQAAADNVIQAAPSPSHCIPPNPFPFI
jgi:hypothetical protein